MAKNLIFLRKSLRKEKNQGIKNLLDPMLHLEHTIHEFNEKMIYKQQYQKEKQMLNEIIGQAEQQWQTQQKFKNKQRRYLKS